MTSLCDFKPWMESDPVHPGYLRHAYVTTCDSPDPICVERRTTIDIYECRSCGARGTVDNGCGN